MKKRIFCLLLALSMIVSVTGCDKEKGDNSGSSSKPLDNSTTSSENSLQNTSSDNVSSSDTQVSSKPPVNSNTSSNTSSGNISHSQGTPPTNPPKYTEINYEYSSNIDIDDNIFMDSLVYTGYNIEKHSRNTD